jgi:hypothetical protein
MWTECLSVCLFVCLSVCLFVCLSHSAKVQKQSLFLNESHSLTELRVICRIVGEWGEANFQATWSHHDLLEPVMKGPTGDTKMDDYIEGQNSES